MDSETIRERIIKLLIESSRPLTAYEIALMLSLDPKTGEKEVYEHLKHVAKTVWRRSGGRYALFMEPPRCRNCGYIFKDLREPKKPSKCPRCKSQRIDPPRFKIMER